MINDRKIHTKMFKTQGSLGLEDLQIKVLGTLHFSSFHSPLAQNSVQSSPSVRMLFSSPSAQFS